MGYKISDIEGIGEVYGKKLSEAGVGNTALLLETAGTKAGRKKLAETTGLSESLILTWTNHADLMRIKGIAGQFSELLEAAGVDTVKELATRNASNLHAKMQEVNDKMGLSGKVPSADELQKMITEAGTLDQKVFH